VKKGRHRRYEEARALKRGPDLDIESILDDLSSDGPARPSGDPDDFDVLEADGPRSSSGSGGDDLDDWDDTDDPDDTDDTLVTDETGGGGPAGDPGGDEDD